MNEIKCLWWGERIKWFWYTTLPLMWFRLGSLLFAKAKKKVIDERKRGWGTRLQEDEYCEKRRKWTLFEIWCTWICGGFLAGATETSNVTLRSGTTFLRFGWMSHSHSGTWQKGHTGRSAARCTSVLVRRKLKTEASVIVNCGFFFALSLRCRYPHRVVPMPWYQCL